MKKVFFFASAFLLLCFLSSPFVSLILPVSLRDHTYREIIMHVIASRQTRGIKEPVSIARRLFYFTAKYTLQNPGDLAPYDDKALGYLINGAVYCDYADDILAVLCAHRGMPARCCMLMDRDGVSPHTVTEVFLDGKWGVFDAAEFYYYSAPGGGIAALDELSAEPGIIFGHKRMQKIRELRPDEYSAKCMWYKKIFPVAYPPQRSKSKIKKITLFDRAGFFYYGLFGKKFLRLYQDAYLAKKTNGLPADQALYYRAKSYQAAGPRRRSPYSEGCLKIFPAANTPAGRFYSWPSFIWTTSATCPGR